MRELIITRPADDQKEEIKDLLLHELVDELMAVEAQRVRVFRTYVADPEQMELYVFTTTSKDIHLGLGAMSRSAQVKLANLLELEFSESECTELLMIRDVYHRREAVLVTVNFVSQMQINFHLAPAR
jgi:hypothetical protein